MHVELDGFEVHLYRSAIDGKIIVDIDSSETSPRDNDVDNCPKFRLMINEFMVESESI